MESAIIKILFMLADYGPGFILASVFIILFWIERKKSDEIASKLQKLAEASIKADLEHTKTYESLENIFRMTIKILSDKRDL
jgi:hypothetical protein